MYPHIVFSENISHCIKTLTTHIISCSILVLILVQLKPRSLVGNYQLVVRALNDQQQQLERIPAIRILALFSESTNDLGIDHKLGRQVLRLAAQRSKQLNNRLEDVELVFVNDDTDCTGLNRIPEQVAQSFYSEQRVCTRIASSNTASNSQTQCTNVNFAQDSNSEADLLENYTNNNKSLSSMKNFVGQQRRYTRQANGIAESPPGGADATDAVAMRTNKLRRTNRKQSIDAIIGPSCEFLVDVVARMAAYWRAPIYSVASIGGKFSKKEIFTTLTRLSPSIDHLSMFILRTMEKFSWRHLAIVIDDKQTDSRLVLDNLERAIAQTRFSIPIERRKFVFDSFRSQLTTTKNASDALNNNNLAKIRTKKQAREQLVSKQQRRAAAPSDPCTREARDILLTGKRNARVFLLLLNEFQVIRRLLLCAHQLGFANGEYTFMALNLGLNSAQLSGGGGDSTRNSDSQLATPNQNTMANSATAVASHEPSTSNANSKMEKNIDWYLAGDINDNNERARKMFESLMVYSIQLPVSSEYDLFVEQVLEGARREFPEARFEPRNVGPMAIALHDSLMLAVEAHIRQHQRLVDIEQQRLELNRNRAKGVAEITTTSEAPLDNIDQYSVLENNDNQSPSDNSSNSSSSSLEAAAASINAGESYQGLGPALLWNETFYDGLMPNLHINSQGDQELDYILSDLEPELGFMRPVASYSKESRQIYFLPTSYIHWPSRVNAYTREPIQGNDKAPPDEPECGFTEDADHCIDRQNLYVAMSVASAVAILISVGGLLGFFKYRQIKYHQQLDDYWWQIAYDELQFIQLRAGASGAGGSSIVGGSIVSVARDIKAAVRAGGSQAGSQVGDSATAKQKPPQQPPPAVPELIVTDNQEAHEAATKQPHQDKPKVTGDTGAAGPVVASKMNATPEGSTVVGESSFGGTNSQIKKGNFVLLADASSRVGTRSMFSSVVRESSMALLRDELVIVKFLNRDSIEITRELLVDLKSMRDHLSDNLAKFMGICNEPGKISIVYEFCSRGSLQDLLLNDSFDLDWTLKYSIIGDILNGLNYIHTTQLGFHGRLKSTNLVLDSRFTVKITDFGLQALYSQIDAMQLNEDDDDYMMFDDSTSTPGDAADSHSQRDTLSLSVSQVGYNPNRSGQSSSGGLGRRQDARDSDSVRKNRTCFKNRRSARHLWQAPEHLRETHSSGSKKGDVYSLAIIFFEIYTRREPYHFGTNAKPNWPAIKAERVKHAMQAKRHSSSQLGNNSMRRRSTRGAPSEGSVGGGGSVVGSALARGSKSLSSKLKRVSTNTVQPALDGAFEDSVVSSGAGRPPSLGGDTRRKSINRRVSRVTLDDSESPGKSVASQQEPELVDVEEILDQIRMSVQPEPVRPYLPNFILQEIDPKLIDLMRQCWHESQAVRPPVAKVRQQMRNITKGQTAKNYLDNLLDRLQKYANDLERILDEKSGDIVSEKQKTENILYQLVPRFVADKLRANEPIIPQLFDCVTIYFSDIINFEKYASILSPVDLVQLLNSLYFSFDSIIDSFDVIKIETILDIYLIASGIKLDQNEAANQANSSNIANSNEQQQLENKDLGDNELGDEKNKKRLLNKAKIISSLRNKAKEELQQNQAQLQEAKANANANNMMISDDLRAQYTRGAAEQVARMALSIRDMINSFRFTPTSSPAAPPINLNIRMGIHSGRVCTGIVGVRRPKFCLIGDTVNVASRMHTNSKANKIQISASTRQLLDQVSGFDIQARGKIEVKGKGQMDTFWLEYAR